MKLKIERPSFEEIIANWDSSGSLAGFDFAKADKWFTECVEPINQLLDSAFEVYARRDAPEWLNNRFEDSTHKAWIIGVEPIKKETAQSLLKRLLDDPDNSIKPIYRNKYEALGEE